MKRSFAAFFATGSLVLGALASVGLSQSAPRTILIHVDQRNPNASDGSNGSSEQPLATIRAAARRALDNRASGFATRVLIHPGTYREQIEIGADVADGTAPLIAFEGTGPDVVLSGADVATDWQPQGGNVYRRVWPFRWGPAPLPSGWEDVEEELAQHPVVQRRELAVANGILLKQVVTRTELSREPQTFHVDEERGEILIHLAQGVDIANTKIELGVRPSIFVANRIGHVLVRGLTFQYAATPLQDAAVQFNSCVDVTVEDIRIQWNSWNALALNRVRDVVLQGVVANDNGAGGIGGWRVMNLLVTDSESSRNNWRGAWGEFRGWATGQKFVGTYNARFVRFRAVQNQATGLWFDTDNAGILLDQVTLSENATRGLYLEAVQGPIAIRESLLLNNGQIGILATSVANLTLDSNVIAGNGEYQIYVPWQVSHHVLRTIETYETRQSIDIRTAGWTMTNNIIGGFNQSIVFSIGNWPWFFQSLASVGNRWYHTNVRNPFGIYTVEGGSPSMLDLRGWQQLSRQDSNSAFLTAPPP